ncbi:drug resistance transporter, Bcr/CflA subfamily [Pseudodesulfovibrio mercurii]|uniref:Drug resistance transporter, Bcr/CflA subfamily n=1 Tax=Pseudodesulfovibrio mercurii TaxID=641491 RepID=F0JCD7_9BACT|nr:multidrug effflux MFS transporter [Pseudodesulfovibrio mercurii]EGB14435.1 drug resistance transporter, Bcr/CflA subfamily [Pseudodesulfovibrio mercurii]
MRKRGLAHLAILAGISTLPPLSIDMNLPAIPDIEATFGVARGQGSLTLSLFLLGFACAPLLGGPLSDRFGRKPVLMTALLLDTLAAFACTVHGSFHFLLLSRLIQGIASGVCILAPLAILRDTMTGPEARKQFSAIMFVGGVAPLAAPLLGGLILLYTGWSAIYAVQGLLGLSLFVLVALLVPESLPPDRRNTVGAAKLLGGYATIFRSPQFLGYALPQALGFGCLFSYIAGSPAFVLGEMHLSEQAYSLVFALTSFGVMVGAFLSGLVGRREIRVDRILAVSLGVMTLAAGSVFVLTWYHAPELPLLLPPLFLVMACFGVLQPNAMSEAVAPWGHMAGTASGAINSLQMLTGAGASALAPLLNTVWAPGKAMGLAMLCAALLASGLYVVFGRARRNRAQAPA